MTTGRDNIDDHAALIASLRSQVAEQRELLERVVAAEEVHVAAMNTPREQAAYDAVGGAIAAIRTHLAGAAVPGESHVFGVGDTVRIAGDGEGNPSGNHCLCIGREGAVVSDNGDGTVYVTGVAINAAGEACLVSQDVLVRDLVLVRKAGT